MRLFKLSLTIIFFLIILPGRLAASEKIDTIYFENGNQNTGEVKSLLNDLLVLSTDHAGTMKIQWTKVDSVYILNRMRIVLTDGKLLYGVLLPSGVVKSCIIRGSAGDSIQLSLNSIVELSPIEDKFVDRLSGAISSGFSYTKASEVMQMSLNGSLKYMAKKNMIEASYGGIMTQEPVEGATQAQTGGITAHRLLPNKWFLTTQLLAESNSEQKLDLRATVGFGIGNSIIRNQRSHFFVEGGILGNRELSEEVDQYNLEGSLGINYSIFIFDNPDISFSVTSEIMPSLSDLGRIRINTESNLNWEVFNDFFLKWSFYHRYDSRPLSTDAEKTDWAVSMLGLEFKL
jgi:hypothetical protein